jgi:hypothetical protein
MRRQSLIANPAVCKEAEQRWLAIYAYDIPTPLPPMVRMSRISVFDWDDLWVNGLHSFAGSDAQDDHMQKGFRSSLLQLD